MHPSLEPYVDPPSLINVRFIVIGVIIGLLVMLIALAALGAPR